ncbi:hypothetical protein PVAND_011924 [Polypedilum vanderplanki]|uniref:Nose resistant-to-fluoxetine protein N-terminal domain-containing protein n=1 Tax=Polypedilum vanderplanki TaxID=319348 RepID=A0A9J6CLR0_POLVA|nr:hypothetical protein PVAND_011924 [Polypedilum vanderplanki]
MSCETNLEYFQNALDSKENWALKMLSSWPKFTSFPVPENLIQFGPFSECQNFHHKISLNSSQMLHGQYCLTSYSSMLWHDFDETSIEYINDTIIEENTIIFKNGICLPASCTSQQIFDFVKSFLRETNFIVLNMFCQKKEEISFQLIDFAVLFIISVLIILTLSGTFLNHKVENTNCNKFLQSFSLFSNFKNLISNDNKNTSIDCLNGLKVISSLWIIIGHRMNMMIEYPNQMKLFMSFEEKIILRIAEMYTSIVDTFFVVSGILVSIKCMKLFKNQKFNYLNFCFSRFSRFVPPLTIIFLFFMSTLPKLIINGPQMSEFEEELEDCRESWIKSLFLLGNFSENLCLRHTWYATVDFQLFIISPAIIYGLFKFGQNFVKMIVVIILLGQINIFILKFSSNVEDEQEEDLFYDNTRYRFMPWFIGIMTGYIMQNVETNSNLLRKKFRALSWVLSCASLIVLEFIRSNQNLSLVIKALYAASHRVIYSCAIAWIIYACHNLKSGSFVRIFLSHRYWRPLSKMCLSIYLGKLSENFI